MRRSLLLIIIAILIVAPLPALTEAAPFGGRTITAWPCFNAAIYAPVGAPRPAFLVWTPATKTYANGPPTHTGQWLLGLSGIPYICLVTVAPIVVLPGLSIYMMGSSAGSPNLQIQQAPIPSSEEEEADEVEEADGESTNKKKSTFDDG